MIRKSRSAWLGDGAHPRTQMISLLCGAAAMLGVAVAKAQDSDAHRAEVRQTADATLQRPSQFRPGTKPAVNRAAVSQRLWLYLLTDAGLVLALTAKGTKYDKDETLK